MHPFDNTARTRSVHIILPTTVVTTAATSMDGHRHANESVPSNETFGAR